MAINVRCECGYTFRVKDAAAGKRVRCRKCEQVLTISRDANAEPFENYEDYEDLPEPLAPRFASSRSSSKKRAKRKRRGRAVWPKRALIGLALACGFAVAIGIGAFVVNVVGDAWRHGQADWAREHGMNPEVLTSPAEPVQTDKTWDPDPDRLEKLREQTLNEFVYRRPADYTLNKDPSPSSNGTTVSLIWYSPRNENQKRHFVQFSVNKSPQHSTRPSRIEYLMKTALATMVAYWSVHRGPFYEWGTLHGKPCLRGSIEGYDRRLRTNSLFVFYIYVHDGKVVSSWISLNPPESQETLELLETAARSIRPR